MLLFRYGQSRCLIKPAAIACNADCNSDGSWKWVKPYPESITVNIADVLQFWSGGFLKSSIHRVVAPPPDQAGIDRLGLLYFLRPAHDLKLKTLDSPLLKRLGIKSENDAADEIRAGDWVKARVKGNLDKAPAGGRKDKEVLSTYNLGRTRSLVLFLNMRLIA